LLYGTDKKLYRKASAMMGMAYYVIKRKFFIDEIYLFVTHKIIFAYIARPIAWFDRHVVDGGVNLSAWITRMTGTMLSFTQTGQVQTYAVWYAIGILLVVLMVLSMAI
jgi:NADH-quinone oxidoreductase subunit L